MMQADDEQKGGGASQLFFFFGYLEHSQDLWILRDVLDSKQHSACCCLITSKHHCKDVTTGIEAKEDKLLKEEDSGSEKLSAKAVDEPSGTLPQVPNCIQSCKLSKGFLEITCDEESAFLCEHPLDHFRFGWDDAQGTQQI